MITNITLLTVLMQIVSIDGQVRDAATRKPLPMAKVKLSHQGVPSAMEYTDAEGRFRFGNVNPGSYTIAADSMDYDSNSIDFDPSMRPFVDLELTRTRRQKQIINPTVSVASALNDLGNRYRKRGDLDRAESSFKQAMELSDSVYIALNLADLYTAQKRFSEAAVVLETAIGRTPDNGDAYYGLAIAYFKQGRLKNAEAAAIQADSRPHRVADLHLLLAKIYAQQNSQKAVEQLKIYLKEAPNGPESGRVRQVLKRAS